VVGDWDGNGTWTVGVVDPFGNWYLRNSNDAGPTDFTVFAYGVGAWTPLAGDWDGNGTMTPGMFDPATGTFYLRNSNTPGGTDAGQFAFGGGGWQPVAGDWNNDGRDTIGVFDPAGQWYLRNDNAPGAPDIGPFAYGAGPWSPLGGDWDGAALRAAAAGAGAAALTDAQLQAFYAAALGSGFSSLTGARVELASLDGDLLGLAVQKTGTILIDDDAAGHGWFVDSTPALDEEFSGGVALAGGPAAGRMDLLTALLHEAGHLAGLGDLDPAIYPDALMAGTLPAGVRRSAGF
jgi:hypothetical protein